MLFLNNAAMRAGVVLVLVAAAASACGRAAPTPNPTMIIAEAHRLDVSGHPDAAITLYEQALAAAPDSFDAHYGLARALDLAGRYDEARAHFTRALTLAPPASRDQTERMLAISWTFVGDTTKVARLFSGVFDRHVAASNFGAAADVASELARVYLEHGDLDEAETWYRRAHDTALREADLADWRVDLAEMRWAHAEARLAARRGQAAAAHRDEARVKALLDKGGNDDQRVQYPYLLGYDAFYLGDAAAAVSHLEQADQTDPFILLLLGQAHERLGHADQARAYYEKVMASGSHAVAAALARPIARQKLASAASPSSGPQ
jgi:tetratricopeptide (TPR) repeat protein